MKKLFSVLLAVALFAAFMVTPALAAGDATVAVGSVSDEVGETVAVNVTIANNPGFVSGKITLSYDKEALELVSLVNGLFKGETNVGTGMANHYGSNVVTGDGTLVTATFKILKAGANSVSVAVSGMRDGSDTKFTPATVGGTVTGTAPECKHVWGEYTQTKAPTCTEKGEETATCENGCGATDTKEIPALGHKFTTYTQTKAPTCTEKGEETATCDNGCGTIDVKKVAALGHKFTTYTQTKAPTCTEKGEKTATCENGCGATDVKEVAALDHKWVLQEEGTVKPTKDKDGVKAYKCERCGATKTEPWKYGKVPATGDITPMLFATGFGIVAMFAAIAYVFKRKAVK